MALTLLQLVTAACNESGIPAPATVINNTAATPTQMLALANRVGRMLNQSYEWRRSVFQYSYQTTAALSKTGNTTANSAVITGMNNTTSLAAGMVVYGENIPSYASVVSVDGADQVTLDMAASGAGTGVTLTFATQDYALPTGFNRLISSTNWDRSDHWMNLGPKSSQEWQWLQGGVIASGPRFRYRIYGNKMRFFPAPQSVYNFAYEYVSDYWVIATGATVPSKASFTVDTDLFIYPDELMISGLKYEFKRAVGMDWEVEYREFDRLRSQCMAMDEDNPNLSLSPQITPVLIGPYSVPDGNWNI